MCPQPYTWEKKEGFLLFLLLLFVCKNIALNCICPQIGKLLLELKEKSSFETSEVIPDSIVLRCDKNSYFHYLYHVQLSASQHSLMQTKASKPLQCAPPTRPHEAPSILWALDNLFLEPTWSPSFYIEQTQTHPRFHLLLFEGGKLWSPVPFLMELAELAHFSVNCWCLWGFLARNEPGSNHPGKWMLVEHTRLWAQLYAEGAKQICVSPPLLCCIWSPRQEMRALVINLRLDCSTNPTPSAGGHFHFPFILTSILISRREQHY